MSSVEMCKWHALKNFGDERGRLSVVTGRSDIPFDIARIFFLYDIPQGHERGAHAHKELHQFLIATSGSFDVTVDDGRKKATFHIDDPARGLHIPPMLWSSLANFAPSSVCLVLASAPFDEEDYYRDYDAFLRAATGTP